MTIPTDWNDFLISVAYIFAAGIFTLLFDGARRLFTKWIDTRFLEEDDDDS